MDPEVLRECGGKYDRKSDVFSFGCVLFYMLTGFCLYPGVTPQEVLLVNMDVNPLLAVTIIENNESLNLSPDCVLFLR